MNIEQTTAPKVSVCVITYNQEAFIGQCLQSIVDQVTDFEFEVIVGDDVSSDGTREVIRHFAERYPGVVRPIYQERNIGGGSHNFRTVHLAARGQYVAHVDGDDYVLPGKLQSQADLLDSRPDVAFAAHAVRVIGTELLIGADKHYPESGSVYDVLRLGTYFVHSSVMYRRAGGGVEAFPELSVDFYMHVERAARGAVFLDKRVLGCYRSHEGSLSQNPARRHALEQHYEAAFDRALALGLDPGLVESARLDRRMRFAITRCVAGDPAGYREMIYLTPENRRKASLKHRVLHSTRWLPGLVHAYFFLQRLRPKLLQRQGF